jgi:hypothetical protein
VRERECSRIRRSRAVCTRVSAVCTHILFAGPIIKGEEEGEGEGGGEGVDGEGEELSFMIKKYFQRGSLNKPIFTCKDDAKKLFLTFNV